MGAVSLLEVCFKVDSRCVSAWSVAMDNPAIELDETSVHIGAVSRLLFWSLHTLRVLALAWLIAVARMLRGRERQRQTDKDRQRLTDWALTFKDKDVKQKPSLTRERARDHGTWQHETETQRKQRQKGALLWTDWWRVHEDRGFAFDELSVKTCFKRECALFDELNCVARLY